MAERIGPLYLNPDGGITHIVSGEEVPFDDDALAAAVLAAAGGVEAVTGPQGPAGETGPAGRNGTDVGVGAEGTYLRTIDGTAAWGAGPPSGAAAGTASLRRLGSGATEAAPGTKAVDAAGSPSNPHTDPRSPRNAALPANWWRTATEPENGQAGDVWLRTGA